MLVSEDRLEKALSYLAQTDEACAEAKAHVLRTEHLAKVAEALAFKATEGPVELRKQIARLAGPSREAWEAHFQAVVAYETLRAKREKEVLVIETWRSLNANQRKGNV